MIARYSFTDFYLKNSKKRQATRLRWYLYQSVFPERAQMHCMWGSCFCPLFLVLNYLGFFLHMLKFLNYLEPSSLLTSHHCAIFTLDFTTVWYREVSINIDHHLQSFNYNWTTVGVYILLKKRQPMIPKHMIDILRYFDVLLICPFSYLHFPFLFNGVLLQEE